MIWILVATNLLTLFWGQYWCNLCHRITDIVNDILSEEDDEGSSEEVPGEGVDPESEGSVRNPLDH